MASYAAAITDATGNEVVTEKGVRGQFDVVVDGKTVLSRKGGLLAMLFRKPWPTLKDVVSAVQSAI